MNKLKRLLDPASVVYVGGSQIAGPIRAARRAGYQGEMYVLNPVKEEIEGIRCATKLSELPVAPDAAVVGLSPERSIRVVSELSQVGCGGAVVMSSGFAELNTDEGRERQRRLVDAAADMPLLGPNCMGLMNQFSGAFVWGDDNHCERQDEPAAAIISQSGALLIGMTGTETAFPLGYAISIGNQAVTSISDLIDAVLEDKRIRAIGLYIEGMNKGEQLGQACLRALEHGVPVIALKGGDQEAGAAVSQSHTASMVVERDLWDSFKIRFGIAEVSSPKALVETLKLLTVAGTPAGNRLSIISYSGGLNGLAATKCSALGIELPDPTEPNKKVLTDTLPETVSIANPLDLNIPFSASDGSISMRDTSGVADAISRFAEGVSDQIVFFIDVPKPGAGELDKVWCDSLEALIEVREKLGVPVSVAGILPEGLPADFRKHMHSKGVAALLGYAETMEAIAIGIEIAEMRALIARNPKPEPLLFCPQSSQSRMLNEAQSKEALNQHGLAVPRFLVANIDDVGSASTQLEYPVAAKVLSDQIPHKAKLGGVKLNLYSADEVSVAAEQMAQAVAKADGGHPVSDVLLEEMITGTDAEVIIGVKRHPALGLALMIGKGGSNVEQMAAYETALLPLCEQDLDRMFRAIQIDQHPAIEQLKKNCKAVEAYAITNSDHLETLDVNPVMLSPDGTAVATDALIVLGSK